MIYADAATADGKTFVLTFHGSGVEYGSLPDGRYTLTVQKAKVAAQANPGANPDADSVSAFHRLFGDVNGDCVVEWTDWGQLFTASGHRRGEAGYLSYLDVNGDAVIDGTDSSAFFARWLKTV
jgi:hypothetical protein